MALLLVKSPFELTKLSASRDQPLDIKQWCHMMIALNNIQPKAVRALATQKVNSDKVMKPYYASVP